MPAERRVERLLAAVVPAAAAAFLLLYVIVALLRLGYPFELEWMEGGVVDHIERILAGRPIYVAPSLDFIPYAYTPLYFYLSAGVAALLGPGFLAPRLVSLLASLGIFWLIFAWVRRETGRTGAGLLAAGLFAAMFRLAGSWFDIARCDALFLLLLLAAAYLLRFGRSLLAAAAAGLVGLLAFLTKQTALPILAPLLLLTCVTDRRRGLLATLVFGGGILASTLVLNALHDGWYNYYVFALPRERWSATPRIGKLIGFWSGDLIAQLSLAIAAAVFFLLRMTDVPRKIGVFHWLFAAAMIGAAWISRAESGGYANVLMPAFAAVAILGGLGFETAAALLRAGREERAEAAAALLHPCRDERAGTAPAVRWLGASLSCAILIQFAVLAYHPRWVVPTAQDRRAGKAFLETLADLPDDIWVPYHGHLPAMAGKPMRAHLMAVADIMESRPGPVREKLSSEIRGALAQQRFAAIVLDEDLWFFQAELERGYAKVRPLLADVPGFWPVTGMRTRPQSLYQPRRSDAADPAVDPAAHPAVDPQRLPR